MKTFRKKKQNHSKIIYSIKQDEEQENERTTYYLHEQFISRYATLSHTKKQHLRTRA